VSTAAKEELDSLLAETREISRQFWELWPQVKDYYFRRKEEDPDLMEAVVSKMAEHRMKTDFEPTPTRHEHLIERTRRSLDVTRCNLELLKNMKEEMEKEDCWE